jgi:putative MATE family efflux protein
MGKVLAPAACIIGEARFPHSSSATRDLWQCGHHLKDRVHAGACMLKEPIAPRANPYLTTPIPALFARTAFPIILIMVVSGFFTVVDALFLGLYAGADALTAVTLTFPLSMLIFALQTMASAGMASLLARALGANDDERAQEIFVAAHGLALLIAAAVAVLFGLFGWTVIELAAAHDQNLAEQGFGFIAIFVYLSPLSFILSLQGDALRSEGRVGLMAGIGVSATLLNIVFNYVLIGRYGLGPMGSACGTMAAQALTLAAVLWLRARGKMRLTLRIPSGLQMTGYWREIIKLGLPPSLNFAGITIGAALIITNVQIWSGANYPQTIAAYGVITRILSFAYMPLMGLSLANQSIAGNNYGANAFDRSNQTLFLACAASLVYAVILEVLLMAFPMSIGRMFVSDANVIADIARILPVIIASYVIAAPIIVLAGYFQALGMAPVAGLLSLTKPYLIQIPLAFLMPFLMGERGIWLATPVGDGIMLIVAIVTLRRVARKTGARMGLLFGSQRTF